MVLTGIRQIALNDDRRCFSNQSLLFDRIEKAAGVRCSPYQSQHLYFKIYCEESSLLSMFL